MPNVTNIPAPRVSFIDERTGLISREWYRFFLNLFTLVGQGNNATTLDDLQSGLPAQDVNVLVSSIPVDVGPPPIPFGDNVVTKNGTQTISGAKTFTNSNNQFNGAKYATPSAYFVEASSYATIGGTNGVILATGATSPGTSVFLGDATTFRPSVDNTRSLGTGTYRYTVVYATTGTINTSDGAQKQQIRSLSDAEQRVAYSIKKLIRAFKWTDAVASKGEDARIHFGVIAQDVQEAFAAEGLDASKYGLFCSDTWIASDGSSQTRLGVRYSELLAFVIAAL